MIDALAQKRTLPEVGVTLIDSGSIPEASHRACHVFQVWWFLSRLLTKFRHSYVRERGYCHDQLVVIKATEYLLPPIGGNVNHEIPIATDRWYCDSARAAKIAIDRCWRWT